MMYIVNQHPIDPEQIHFLRSPRDWYEFEDTFKTQVMLGGLGYLFFDESAKDHPFQWRKINIRMIALASSRTSYTGQCLIENKETLKEAMAALKAYYKPHPAVEMAELYARLRGAYSKNFETLDGYIDELDLIRMRMKEIDGVGPTEVFMIEALFQAWDPTQSSGGAYGECRTGNTQASALDGPRLCGMCYVNDISSQPNRIRCQLSYQA